MLTKIWWAIVSIILMLSVAAGVYLIMMTVTEPAYKPGLPVFQSALQKDAFMVKGTTLVRKEYEYLCGDVYIEFLGPAPQELVSMGREALLEKYPATDGWAVETTGNMLVLRKICHEFCPEHKNYRHLGVHEGLVAVYQGPLGHNEVLLRVEKSMPLDRLPVEYQVKLEQVMSYNQQLPEIQAQLRSELEFPGESGLNATLENLDELINTGPAKEPDG